MNNAKIWVLVTGIVVIVSGFLLYSMMRSKEAEKAAFMVKIQELNGRLAEIDTLKEELEKAKKDKAELEASSQGEITALENQITDLKKSETNYRAKVDGLLKEKDSLTKYMENNNAIIAKLNKKIETLQKERSEMIEAKRRGEDGGLANFVDPMNEPALYNRSPESDKPTLGAKLVNEEIVDLGRILVHSATNEAARVEHVNPLYGFVVMSAGTNDGLQKDSVVNITRNNRLIAKAVIKKVRDNVSSAVTLPEWTREEIRVGDMISVTTPAPLPKR
jgi:predicted nuclease with TOPRIM domain